MVKGSSEGDVRAALNSMALPVLVYKPPDDARNWKPSDFMVWWRGGSALIEVKMCPNRGTFPIAGLRPAQRAAITKANQIHLPFWLVIWWRSRARWTVSSGAKIADLLAAEPDRVSLDYDWLASVAGMDCTTRDLAPILRSVLLGEVD